MTSKWMCYAHFRQDKYSGCPTIKKLACTDQSTVQKLYDEVLKEFPEAQQLRISVRLEEEE